MKHYTRLVFGFVGGKDNLPPLPFMFIVALEDEVAFPMWLVFCSLNDAAAVWAYQGLCRSGLSPVHLIAVESLSYCSSWNHRLKATGDSTSFTLPDGRVIESQSVRGTVNRVLAPATIQLTAAVPEDRGYAAQEMFSFYVSWLKTLPTPILNAPTPQGLCGRWRHLSEWIWLATQAGLQTPRFRMSSRDASGAGQHTPMPAGQTVKTAVVVRDAVFGMDLPSAVTASCVRLAELAELETLGIDFYYGENGEWTFASATPMPDFRLGSWPLIEKLSHILKG